MLKTAGKKMTICVIRDVTIDNLQKLIVGRTPKTFQIFDRQYFSKCYDLKRSWHWKLRIRYRAFEP